MELIPTTPDQRRSLYADVEELISPGFLSHRVKINGVWVCLRSICPRDEIALKHFAQTSVDREWRELLVAHTLWAVGATELLTVPNAPALVWRQLRRIPWSALNKLATAVLSLHNRMVKAVNAVEPYCYEQFSRFEWRAAAHGGFDPERVSGVRGARRLGLNPVQQMWVVFNTIEDQRFADMRYWQGCKLIASPHAPKGIKQLNSSDARAWQEEEDRRQQVLDIFFYESMGLNIREALQPSNMSYDAKTGRYHARSIEEMEAEMKRQIAGEEDFHDSIVRGWKEMVMARRYAEQEGREQRLQELQDRMVDSPTEIGPTTAYTPDQITALGAAPGRRVALDEAPDYNVLDRYVKHSDDHARRLLEIRDGKITTKQGYRILSHDDFMKSVQEPPKGGTQPISNALDNRRVVLGDDGRVGSKR